MIAESVRCLGWGFEAERGAIDLHDLGRTFLERERVSHFGEGEKGENGVGGKWCGRGIKMREREREREGR